MVCRAAHFDSEWMAPTRFTGPAIAQPPELTPIGHFDLVTFLDAPDAFVPGTALTLACLDTNFLG
jgi:hypothetical protein